MKIGVPKEIKNNEFRVGLTPDSVSKLSSNHKVYVEQKKSQKFDKIINIRYIYLDINSYLYILSFFFDKL